MASPSKQLVSVTVGSSDYDIGQSVRRREDYRSKTNLEDQLGLLPVLTFTGSTHDETYVVENSLTALKVRRVEEYRQPVYIPPMAKANLQAKDEDLFPLMDRVQEFLDSDRQVMLILGDSGAGKSTFNRHLEHHLWTHYTNGDPIPLIINLPAIERPDQDMITKQLQMHDISNDQIQEMKHHCQFILICDGYDESQLSANLHQTNRLNQRGQWRTKMIISCRTQFLGPVYLDRFAPQLTDRYTKARSDLFQEAVIAPFSTKQVEDYVARYVPLEPRPWVTEDYMLMLTTIPNLMDLVRNPFLLTLTLEALPRAIKDQKELSTISISRVQLYDCFVNEWLGVNMRRLRDNKLTDNEREILEHMIEKGFIFLGVEYSKKLAAAIFVRNGGKPVVQYLHYDHKNTWRAKFFGPKSEVRFLRESSPLTRTGSLYRFIHRSMLEYFFSRTVFDPCAHGDDDEFAPQPDFQTSDFLRERVKQSSKFEKQLRAVIDLSKTDARTAIAAANAMTILVRAGSLFNGADLQGIRIPGADLSGGQFDSAQLQGADLRGVNFTRSWLRQTNLTHTRMEGVRFGELPYLKEEDEVTACAYSPDGTRFVTGAVGDESGIINVYDTTTWTKINTFRLDKEKDFCPPNRITIKSIAFSPDSRHFVTGSDDGTVRLWVCANGLGGLKVKEGPDKNQVWVAFSPCGKKVASACEGGSARFWDAETGETVFVMEGYTGGVKSVECSPDGSRVVLGCNDGTIRFWDALTGEQGASMGSYHQR
ncbi:WD_REPEATS_REGION domain-containing protein [Linnemannia gamsii]|uniref:WD_REPEATS_REGION domain-containing protein n=1 Tax=Linnemannia gamsii TaxID=64522 RepID=A0A9P6UGQ9_9FUNG|nr:WD_REPEATS_REGION domain-containing protein [Linnemannia gamsii]